MPKKKSNKNRKQSRDFRYITKLAEDLKRFREREVSGEKITSTERRNMRARELRAMKKMKQASSQLMAEANRVYSLLQERGIETLTLQRVKDDFKALGREGFSLDDAKSYNDIVDEITRASSFLNSPDTNVLSGTREMTNAQLRQKYGDKVQSLQDNTYLQSGLIPTEADAKTIFANYRRIEEFHSARIGKQGQKGVYGSENLILYMIDVHNRGLDELEYGLQALDQFDIEQTPEFQELLKERNRVTGISGLFQKGGLYGKLEGLL